MLATIYFLVSAELRKVYATQESFLICRVGRSRCVIATIMRHLVISLWHYNRRHRRRLTSECHSPNEFQVFVGSGRVRPCANCTKGALSASREPVTTILGNFE